jgi:hypothetical protein
VIFPYPAPHRSLTKHPRVNVAATQPWIIQPRPHRQQQRQHDTAEERALIGAAYFLVHLACVGRRSDAHVLGGDDSNSTWGKRWEDDVDLGEDEECRGREVLSWSLRIFFTDILPFNVVCHINHYSVFNVFKLPSSLYIPLVDASAWL